jgi:hypothetical protein
LAFSRIDGNSRWCFILPFLGCSRTLGTSPLTNSILRLRVLFETQTNLPQGRRLCFRPSQSVQSWTVARPTSGQVAAIPTDEAASFAGAGSWLGEAGRRWACLVRVRRRSAAQFHAVASKRSPIGSASGARNADRSAANKAFRRDSMKPPHSSCGLEPIFPQSTVANRTR